MISRLAKCIREYKKSAILSPLLITLETIMEGIIPLMLAYLIDYGVTAGEMPVIIRIGLALLLAASLSLFFGIMSGKHAAIASVGFAKNVRQDMYYNIQTFSFSNIDKFSPPSLITRLTTDVTNIQNAFQMLLRISVRSPVMLVFSLLMSFSINARLSLIFLLAIPLLAIGLYLILTNAFPLFQKVFKLYDKLNGVVQENLRGIRVVKSFVREEHEIKKFQSASEDIFQSFTKAEKIVSFNAPLMQFCMYGCTLLLSWFGAKMIVNDAMTTGQFVSLLSYIMQILMSLMMISMVFLMITISRASALRIVEVLNENTDLANGSRPINTVADGSIQFERVSFSYHGDREKLCMEGINLTINAGETVGIIGGTGSSKTTLAQLIPRLYDVTEGCIRVGGVDVRDYDLKTLRDNVAVVLQKNELFSGTVKENLRWGNKNAADAELEWSCRLAQADEFIRTLPNGYDTYIEQGGSNVSGGQKQRLCIARALLKNPKILILDDSTSAIDTKTDALLRQALTEELPDITKIIIAQRVLSVAHADKIVVLDNGLLQAVGTHAELLQTCQIYQEVYASQKGGGKIDVA